MTLNYPTSLLIIFGALLAPICSDSIAATAANNLCQVLNAPKPFKKIRPMTSQIVVVKSLGGINAQMILCQWQKNAWAPRFAAPFPAVVGKKGIASLGSKKEGDLKTPAGLYPIGDAFGTKPLAIQMDYKYITADDKFIDDVNHQGYNTWVAGFTDAKSYETMLSAPYLYGAIINYNKDPVVAGRGSAIFIHVWRSPSLPTAGCIALEKEQVVKLLYWLDKKQHPYVLIQEK